VRRGLLISVWLLLCSAPAAAQETGGSVGGSDFGGSSSSSGGSRSSGGSSSSGGSWSSGTSSSGGSSSSSGSRYREMTPSEREAACRLTMYFLGIPMTLLFLVVALQNYLAQRRRRPNPSIRVSAATGSDGRPPSDDTPSDDARDIDVSSIVLAIDWRARRAIQTQLTWLATSAAVTTRAGRLQLLRDAAGLLLGSESSWLYAAVGNHDPVATAAAEQTFRRLTSDARAAYRKEVVRADEAGVDQASAGDLHARREEGPGVVVVTLVVACRTRILDLADPTNASGLRALLSRVAEHSLDDLVAIEVIWSPAAEADRMSTAELETLYPELRRIDERTMATGRVFCTYCNGPFTAELMKCPHCGASLELDPEGRA
jgi:uncharacterized membrane protein